MSAETVLITGALGFTARHVIDRLANRGFDLHGLVLSAPSRPDPRAVTYHECNLLDPAALRAVVARIRPGKVLHLAGISFAAHDRVDDIYTSNIIGTRHLLDALSRAPDPLSRIIIASSASVYGSMTSAMMSEDEPIAPLSDYGVSKAGTELVARLFMDRLPILIARPFNYTGVGQSRAFLIPKIVQHARERAINIELGNLDLARDFSDVRDVADIYARLLDAPATDMQPVNICSGVALPLRTVLKMVEDLSGHRLEVRTNASLVRRNEVLATCGDKRRLEALIGPTTIRPIDETITWMLGG